MHRPRFLPVLQIVCVLHGPFRFVQRLARIAAAGVRPAGRLQHNGPHRWVLDARSVSAGAACSFPYRSPSRFLYIRCAGRPRYIQKTEGGTHVSRAKAFWLGLGCTLAVLLPIYLAVAAVIFTRAARPPTLYKAACPLRSPRWAMKKTFC